MSGDGVGDMRYLLRKYIKFIYSDYVDSNHTRESLQQQILNQSSTSDLVDLVEHGNPHDTENTAINWYKTLSKNIPDLSTSALSESVMDIILTASGYVEEIDLTDDESSGQLFYGDFNTRCGDQNRKIHNMNAFAEYSIPPLMNQFASLREQATEEVQTTQERRGIDLADSLSVINPKWASYRSGKRFLAMISFIGNMSQPISNRPPPQQQSHPTSMQDILMENSTKRRGIVSSRRHKTYLDALLPITSNNAAVASSTAAISKWHSHLTTSLPSQ